MNNIANKQVICDVLMREAAKDRDIVVLCSDSRGSASMTGFAEAFPEQFVEIGIAEQNLVSVAAGLAKCGKKSFAVSPACFLSTRSMEQVKVDVAYSGTNVTLVGISGGVSYGALGMTHHSTNDIAALASIPGIEVYLPSDRFQTEKLVQHMLQNPRPAYIRVGRNAVDDVYTDGNVPFAMGRATLLSEGNDVAIVACGELVKAAVDAGERLNRQGIGARVLDMYCVKPLDIAAVEAAARETKAVVTIEEHVAVGGLGSMVSQVVSRHCPKPVANLCLPDAPVVTGNSKQVFDHYGLNADGIVDTVQKLVK